MLARSESEYVFAHHDHAGFNTVVAGPHVLKSLDRSLKIGDEHLARHPYPTWIIQADSADYFLEHFSALETGYEGSPNQLVKKVKDGYGNYLAEEVLFQFDRRNSTRRGFYEYDLVSGLDLSQIGRADEIIADRSGLVGRLWAKDNKQIWKYLALVLTGNEAYQGSRVRVDADSSVISFLTDNNSPSAPDSGILFINQATQAA